MAASEATVVVSVPYSMLPGRSQTAADIANMALIRDVFNAERKERATASQAGGKFSRVLPLAPVTRRAH